MVSNYCENFSLVSRRLSRQLWLILIFGIIATAAFAQKTDVPLSADKTSTKNNTEYTYKIVPSINNTFGYNINKGEKCLIKQLNIPGIPGNNGFKTAEDAEKVAKLVIRKLEKGEMPPSVTSEELKNLKVIITNTN